MPAAIMNPRCTRVVVRPIKVNAELDATSSLKDVCSGHTYATYILLQVSHVASGMILFGPSCLKGVDTGHTFATCI